MTRLYCLMFLEAGLSGLKSKRLQGWLLLEARGDTLTLSPSQPLGAPATPGSGLPGSLQPPLGCWSFLKPLGLLRWALSDNPGSSLRLMILHLIPFAKILLPCEVIFTGSPDTRTQCLGRQDSAYDSMYRSEMCQIRDCGVFWMKRKGMLQGTGVSQCQLCLKGPILL